jgi:uncharacterized protein (TIGR03083 family)
MDIWPVVHSERKALASDLKPCDEAQWSTPSLSSGWTVRDALAHMTATANMTPASFLPKLASSGFRFARLQAAGIAAQRGTSPADTLARFEAIINSTGRPPGPPATMLGEVLVHCEDIRRPLGLSHEFPTQAAVQVADFFKNSNLLIGSKRRIAGLTLRATDTDWSHGSGPEVSGPIHTLVMAMTGRKAVLDDLSGDGVATLRERP